MAVKICNVGIQRICLIPRKTLNKFLRLEPSARVQFCENFFRDQRGQDLLRRYSASLAKKINEQKVGGANRLGEGLVKAFLRLALRPVAFDRSSTIKALNITNGDDLIFKSDFPGSWKRRPRHPKMFVNPTARLNGKNLSFVAPDQMVTGNLISTEIKLTAEGQRRISSMIKKRNHKMSGAERESFLDVGLLVKDNGSGIATVTPPDILEGHAHWNVPSIHNLKSAIDFLVKATAWSAYGSESYSYLMAVQREFQKRYSDNGSCILDVFTPEFVSRLKSSEELEMRIRAQNLFQKEFAQLFAKRISDRIDVLELTDEEVELLSKTSEGMDLPVTSRGVAFVSEIVSGESYNSSESLLYLKAIMQGPPERFFSRYSHEHKKLKDFIFSDLNARFEESGQNPLFAEVSLDLQMPLSPVLKHFPLTQFAVALNHHPSAQANIDLSDLYMQMKGDKIDLYSASMGRSVQILNPKIDDFSTHPNPIYKFLCCLASRGSGFQFTNMPLGSFELAGRLPEIRYKGILLRPKSIVCHPSEVLEARKHVGRFASAGDLGRPKFVDLDDQVAVQNLVKETKGPIRLFADPEVNASCEDSSIHENIFPFLISSNKQSVKVASRKGYKSLRVRTKLDIFGSIQSVEIPMTRESANSAGIDFLKKLRGRLAKLGIKEWFYLFYALNDYHLRLRIKSSKKNRGNLPMEIAKVYRQAFGAQLSDGLRLTPYHLEWDHYENEKEMGSYFKLSTEDSENTVSYMNKWIKNEVSVQGSQFGPLLIRARCVHKLLDHFRLGLDRRIDLLREIVGSEVWSKLKAKPVYSEWQRQLLTSKSKKIFSEFDVSLMRRERNLNRRQKYILFRLIHMNATRFPVNSPLEFEFYSLDCLRRIYERSTRLSRTETRS